MSSIEVNCVRFNETDLPLGKRWETESGEPLDIMRWSAVDFKEVVKAVRGRLLVHLTQVSLRPTSSKIQYLDGPGLDTEFPHTDATGAYYLEEPFVHMMAGGPNFTGAVDAPAREIPTVYAETRDVGSALRQHEGILMESPEEIRKEHWSLLRHYEIRRALPPTTDATYDLMNFTYGKPPFALAGAPFREAVCDTLRNSGKVYVNDWREYPCSAVLSSGRDVAHWRDGTPKAAADKRLGLYRSMLRCKDYGAPNERWGWTTNLPR